MNPKRLLQHFNEITEAPDAVPRLRRFILDLAVRGKLVEQDPADEPASDLLKRIEAEKERLTKAGELRKHRREPLDEEEIAFTIPSAWSWTYLAQIGIINPQNDSEGNAEASFIPMRMIYAEYGQPCEHEIRPWGEISRGFTHFADGDVGLAKITPCFENGKSTVFRNLTGGIGAGTTELHIVRPIFVVAEYILIFLKSSHFIEAAIPKMTGTAGQKRVPKDYFAFSPFPLPPLSEQQRIVGKVDELMMLCDELEAAQAKREWRRDRLVAATLHGLNNGNDSSETGGLPVFEEGARFYFNHFPHLTTRPEHIHQLRQTILNLAVRGKLVPQDPKDEPASELMKRIEVNKAQLFKEGNIRKQKGLPPIRQKDVPFDLPENWEWVRLGDVCFTITDGAHHTPHYTEKGVPFLSVKDVSSGKIDFSNTRFISQESHNELCRRCKPESGDILLTKVGTTGIAVPVNTSREFSIFVSIALLKFSVSEILQPFLVHLLNSPFARKQSAENTQGIGNKNLVLRLINPFAIPVPPLAEQHRIVAKVDELMALCDEVEARITTTATTRRQLLEATIHEALKKRSLPEVSYEN